MKGKYINYLQHMIKDPNYSTPDIEKPTSIKRINIENNGDTVNVALPGLVHYIYQQMFAFNNLIREFNQKALINYRRIMFIRLLIEKYNLNTNNKNKNNFKKIINTFGDNSSTEIITFIDSIIAQSKNLYSKNISLICKRITIADDDEFLKKLCSSKERTPVKITTLNGINHFFSPKEFIKSSNGIIHPVFNTEEEENKWISIFGNTMRPVKGAGLKKRTRYRKHKTQKRKTHKHSKK
jgi:hypothetical protein